MRPESADWSPRNLDYAERGRKMRAARWGISILGVLGLLLFISTGADCRAESISLRADAWAPLNDVAGAALPGYGIEIAKAVLEKNGISLDYQTMPWNRATQEAAEGNIDAIIGASHGDCETCVFPKEPIGKMDNHFFVKKGNQWRYNGIPSLSTVKVAAVDGYDYDGGELNTYLGSKKGSDDVQLMTGDGALEKNIKKLQAGRVDVVIEEKSVFYWTLKSLGIAADEFEEAGSTGKADPIFIAFSPKKPKSSEYAKQIEEGIAALRASGELAKILSKYGVSDWK